MVEALSHHLFVLVILVMIVVGGAYETIQSFAKSRTRAIEASMRREDTQAELGRIRSRAPLPVALPGACGHVRKDLVPVVLYDGDLAAWLCVNCDQQLPAEFAEFSATEVEKS